MAYTWLHIKENRELALSHDSPMIKTPDVVIIPVKNWAICARVNFLAALISVVGDIVLIRKYVYINVWMTLLSKITMRSHDD